MKQHRAVTRQVTVRESSVVTLAAASSAPTTLSLGRIEVTISRMAIDQLEPMAHKAEKRTAWRTTPMGSPR